MNVIADALSRVIQLDFEDHNVDKEVLAVNILTYISYQREGEDRITERNKDAELQVLKSSKKRSSLTPSLQSYWNYRDELKIIDGILIKG